MLPTFISSLATKGLKELSEGLFGGLIDKGKDGLEDIIHDVTGLDIDLDSKSKLTEDDINILKVKQEALLIALEETKERNRHDEYQLAKDVEFATLDVDDVKDARGMYKEQIKSESKFTAHFLEIFSLIILGLAGLSIWFVLSGNVSEEYMTLSMSVVEFAKAAVITVISFWVGSSHSSRLKDQAFMLKKEDKWKDEVDYTSPFDMR